MKTIIAGSTSITNYDVVKKIITNLGLASTITEVVSGTADGVDKLGEQYALEHGFPVKPFPARWERYGMNGGSQRDLDMVKYSDQLIAIWDGSSPGTARTIEFAKEHNLKMYVYIVSEYELNI